MAKWQLKTDVFKVNRAKWEKDFWTAMQESAEMVEEHCKGLIGRSGYPKNVSGNLRRSIKAQARRSGNDMTVKLYSTAVYAPRLEFGFKGTISYTNENGTLVSYKVTQKERPFMRHTIAQTKGDILRHIGRKARFK